jgi:hypothetical protein
VSRPAAVDLAREAGFSVVPADMNKRPKVKWKAWQTERQTDEEFGELGHGSVWGVVTGALYGITVLDFDFEAGGEETLQELNLPPHVLTPGGAHVYVNHPGHPVKNAARKWDEYPGLDVRGDGGLAWFAGRSKKGKYEPVHWPPEPIDIDPALAEVFFPHPQETAARAPEGEWTGEGHGTPEAYRYVVRLVQDIAHAEPGTSNAVLNRAGYSVGGLIASGQLDGEWAYDALFVAAVERGAGDPETVLTVAIETGKAHPWAFTPEEDEYVPAITMRMFSQRGVPEAVPFPVDAFPAPLDEFIRQGAEAVSCPPDYLGTALLPALGVGIGGYVDLEITPDGWSESALIYAALVGPPGVRKSPPLRLVMAPIWAAEKALYEDYQDQEGWQETAPPDIVVDDTTVEAMYVALEKNPRGLLMRADELKGWVAGMGQYKGGAGRDRQTWLSIWSREPLKVTRKTTSSHRIEEPFVAVVGGIQPEVLEELMQSREDGLLPRLLMAGGDYVTPVLRRNVLDPAVRDGYGRIWDRLRDEGMVARTVQFTEAGYRAYETWANEHYKTLLKVPRELAGAWAKMDAQAARIALILSRVLDTDVTPEVVDRAVALVRYYQGQAARLLQSDGGSGSRWEKQNAQRTRALARFLLDNPGAGRAEIMDRFEWAMDVHTLDKHLQALTDVGLWNG